MVVNVQSPTAQLGPKRDILESDRNGIIPERARVITQVVILDASKSADTVRGKTAASYVPRRDDRKILAE